MCYLNAIEIMHRIELKDENKDSWKLGKIEIFVLRQNARIRDKQHIFHRFSTHLTWIRRRTEEITIFHALVGTFTAAIKTHKIQTQFYNHKSAIFGHLFCWPQVSPSDNDVWVIIHWIASKCKLLSPYIKITQKKSLKIQQNRHNTRTYYTNRWRGDIIWYFKYYL